MRAIVSRSLPIWAPGVLCPVVVASPAPRSAVPAARPAAAASAAAGASDAVAPSGIATCALVASSTCRQLRAAAALNGSQAESTLHSRRERQRGWVQVARLSPCYPRKLV